MISFFRPPLRSAGATSVPTLSSVAVTLLGLRVTRAQILRISGLLALRSLAGLIEVPLDDGVQAYLWTFLFSSAQAGVALATAASLFDFGGIATRVLSRVFPPAVDGPFLHLYARVVLVAGPLTSCAEAAVIVYEAMRVARSAEHAMYRAEATGARFPRPALIAAACTALCCVFVVVAMCARVAGPIIASPPAVAACLLFVFSFMNSNANVVEASIIALYVAIVWGFAVVEEATLDAPLLTRLRGNAAWTWASADDVRAATLITSLVFLFASMSRSERFIRVLAYSQDAVEAEEVRIQAAQNHEQSNEVEIGNDDSSKSTQPARNKTLRALISTLTLLAATFRMLLWAGQVQKGEYLPIPCRSWQLLVSVLLYALFMRM